MLRETALCSLQAVVLDEQQRPIKGARVVVYEDVSKGPLRETAKARTESDGTAIVAGLMPKRRYWVSAEAIGLATVINELQPLSPGETLVAPAIVLRQS